MNNILDGMEMKVGQFYLDGTKEVTINDYSIVNITENLVENSHGLKEIRLNMSNVLVSGSGSFYEKTMTIYTKYKLEINKKKFIPVALESCRNDTDC